MYLAQELSAIWNLRAIPARQQSFDDSAFLLYRVLVFLQKKRLVKRCSEGTPFLLKIRLWRTCGLWLSSDAALGSCVCGLRHGPGRLWLLLGAWPSSRQLQGLVAPGRLAPVLRRQAPRWNAHPGLDGLELWRWLVWQALWASPPSRLHVSLGYKLPVFSASLSCPGCPPGSK